MSHSKPLTDSRDESAAAEEEGEEEGDLKEADTQYEVGGELHSPLDKVKEAAYEFCKSRVTNERLLVRWTFEHCQIHRCKNLNVTKVLTETVSTKRKRCLSAQHILEHCKRSLHTPAFICTLKADWNINKKKK